MGDDEIIPNGSVHWSISHEQVGAGSGGGGRRRRKWRRQGANIISDGNEPVNIIGNNDFVSGVDTIDASDVQELRVTLRFRTIQELLAAIGGGVAGVQQDPVTNMFVMEFAIPSNGASVSTAQATAPPPNPWAQIQVEW